ncbi:MAG: Crp/Fnr family transcriptional regulator [Planctomycetota bacterium]|nr:MAG: Crp/Fnr family transcriptional regulator [Planctomycetota bacterium]
MDSKVLADVLAKLRFSESLPDEVLQRVAAASKLEGYAAGSVLFREGMQNDVLMVVAVGRVALDMHVPGRGEVRILSLGPGDMVAWSALLGGGRMTTSAVALDDTQVVAISAADAQALCETDPTFGYHLMRQVAMALAHRLVATRLQLLDLFADTPPAIPQGPD